MTIFANARIYIYQYFHAIKQLCDVFKYLLKMY